MYLRVDDEPHRSAVAAVTAVGSAERLELLPVYRGASVATVSGRHMNGHAVDEPRHRHSHFLIGGISTSVPILNNESPAACGPAKCQ